MSKDQIIPSGLLELYVIGDLSQSEKLRVEKAMEQDDTIKYEILAIEKALEAYALGHAVSVTSAVKPMLFAQIDFNDRLLNGEVPVTPPSLSPESKIADFSQWLQREDMQEPETYESMHGRIINSTEEKTTLIIWLKHGAPDETHTDEIEKFLIVEGSCEIKIGNTVHSLERGDYLSIPLFINHNVKVTSDFPCKIILERAAA
ncbi:MAG: cupin domain-containing protein [Saprospiraceae bacterium]